MIGKANLAEAKALFKAAANRLDVHDVLMRQTLKRGDEVSWEGKRAKVVGFGRTRIRVRLLQEPLSEASVRGSSLALL